MPFDQHQHLQGEPFPAAWPGTQQKGIWVQFLQSGKPLHGNQPGPKADSRLEATSSSNSSRPVAKRHPVLRYTDPGEKSKSKKKSPPTSPGEFQFQNNCQNDEFGLDVCRRARACGACREQHSKVQKRHGAGGQGRKVGAPLGQPPPRNPTTNVSGEANKVPNSDMRRKISLLEEVAKSTKELG